MAPFITQNSDMALTSTALDYGTSASTTNCCVVGYTGYGDPYVPASYACGNTGYSGYAEYKPDYTEIKSWFFYITPLNRLPLKIGHVNTQSHKRVFSTIRRGIVPECKYYWRRKKAKKA